MLSEVQIVACIKLITLIQRGMASVIIWQLFIIFSGPIFVMSQEAVSAAFKTRLLLLKTFTNIWEELAFLIFIIFLFYFLLVKCQHNYNIPKHTKLVHLSVQIKRAQT